MLLTHHSVLLIAGCAYSIFGVVFFVGNMCWKCCCESDGGNAADLLMNAGDGYHGMDSLDQKEQAEFVRQQRLKALYKENAIEQSKNMEAQLAKQLGMDFGGESDDIQNAETKENGQDKPLMDDVPELESEEDDHEDSDNAEE